MQLAKCSDEWELKDKVAKSKYREAYHPRPVCFVGHEAINKLASYHVSPAAFGAAPPATYVVVLWNEALGQQLPGVPYIRVPFAEAELFGVDHVHRKYIAETCKLDRPLFNVEGA